ncbi:hypothetical protein [Ralstonia sp. OTU4908]|jgi:hypothetical protein|uniref:hypothetical protein n=1 Tax=Ralstonia sp. OTU4908 TaxID=3043851 RepID=UPI00313F10FE
MGTLNIWLSDEDEAFMRRQMEIAGETKLGPHIKRVYYGNLNPGEGVLSELRRNSEMALSMLSNMKRSGSSSGDGEEQKEHDRDTELRLLAAIFLMLHMSLGKDARLVIDRYVSSKAVEDFLKAGGGL